MIPSRCQQWRQWGARPTDHGVLGALLETEEGVAPVTTRPVPHLLLLDDVEQGQELAEAMEPGRDPDFVADSALGSGGMYATICSNINWLP